MPDQLDNFIRCLTAHPTASAALETWCRARYRNSVGPLAVRVLDDREADPQPDGTRIRFRRVAIHWEGAPVSIATNIYFPGRLPKDVVQDLLTTDIPFGTLLRGFEPKRLVQEVRTLDQPDFALEIRASLSLADGLTVASVHETYHRSLLGQNS